jgi:guanylate kinase
MTNKLIIILSAPSGTGKTTIARSLSFRFKELFSTCISHTTRTVRVKESDKVNYFFVSKETFSEMIKKQEFAEYNKVYENYYGTSTQQIESLFSQNKIPVLDIDPKGGDNLSKKYRCVKIFLYPPSLSQLKKRLILRKRETLEEIDYRMSCIENEIKYAENFDYLICNDNFKNTVDNVRSIAIAEQLKYHMQIDDLKSILIKKEPENG